MYNIYMFYYAILHYCQQTCLFPTNLSPNLLLLLAIPLLAALITAAMVLVSGYELL